jgi:pyruvate/2-oxoglutarate/acetoin dehydrogenase E1 component
MRKSINDVFFGRLEIVFNRCSEELKEMSIDCLEDIINETKRLQFQTKGNHPTPTVFRMAVQNVAAREEYIPTSQRRNKILEMVQ